MKKRLLLFSGILIVLTLFAQNKVVIHLNDHTTKDVAVSNIDSIFFNTADTSLNLRLQGDSLLSLRLAEVDSITMADTLLPVVKTVSPDKILQTSARSGVTVVSPGASAITSKGICYGTNPLPTIADKRMGTSSTSSTVQLYMVSLTGSTTYYVRAYATNSYGTSYGAPIAFETASYNLPVVETVSAVNGGGLEATCTGKVTSMGGYTTFLARGFCWSRTNPEPTLADSVSKCQTTLLGDYTMDVKLPVANVTYYVRAYATNGTGTSYGAVTTVKPTMGSLTYTLAASVTGSQYYNLIKTAMDSVLYYYNRYGTFSGNIWVYYDAGIPTAQASYRGSIGFGSNTSYMHVCTAMHETAHWLGSGTSTSWKSFCNSGRWTGPTAVAMLKSLTGATLYCDNNTNLWHFWPYGLNQRSEVTLPNGLDYIYHVKIVNAMKTDCGW